MSLINVNDLSIGYEGQPIVENINFTVSEGDYLCIIGENGSGKTTLMRTLLGLQEPIKGTISFAEGLSHTDIGFLPQQSAIQKDFPASVWEIVLSGNLSRKGLRPFYSNEEKKLAMEMLEKMNITDLKDKSYRKLSGGQQQRVLLARALCAARKVLIMDEPVTGLDPQAAKELYKLTGKLHEEGTAIIMITHDVDAALTQANHILQIGRNVRFMTIEEYLGKEDK